MIYDIFISYRRKGGFDIANHLYDRLSQDGYTVSFDIDTLREGDFDKALFERIELCRDVLVIVDEHAFDRMVNPAPDYDPEKDWMRKEIAYALTLKKNIVSVILPGASYPKKLPDDLNRLDVKNGPEYSQGYFGKFYERLKEFLYSVPRTRKDPGRQTVILKVKADIDCFFFMDGEEQEQLKANKVRKLSLTAGDKYDLEFVSVENELDCWEKLYQMPSHADVLPVPLATKRAERLEKEAAEKEARRQAFLKDQIIQVKDVSFVMKPVEGGQFKMGAQKLVFHEENYDAEASDYESPVHDVTLSSFYMGETVVTQALWKAVMGVTVKQQRDKANASWPLRGEGDDYPMYYVSYDEIVNEFLPRLNRLTGKAFRLPTEAEWEYAARGGKKGKGCKYAGSDILEDVAWYEGNSGGQTHAVKTKSPNELGLYDMSGNVWEWCQDWHVAYDSISQIDLVGPSGGLLRVIRGGCWFNIAKLCRVSSRFDYAPGGRRYTIGFRLVLPQ
jgi:formylglycine-generating enzyme required for sulfatase activity